MSTEVDGDLRTGRKRVAETPWPSALLRPAMGLSQSRAGAREDEDPAEPPAGGHANWHLRLVRCLALPSRLALPVLRAVLDRVRSWPASS